MAQQLFKYLTGNTNLLLDNIEGKKVLVLGSGPSATEINWIEKDWEVLVTTSFFYLVPEILEQKPLHVTLSDIVDLRDKRLLNYLDKNPKCTIAFEPKASHFYNSAESEYRAFSEKYKDRIILYNIARGFGGREGVAARVCWPVMAAQPKSLLICGIDGVSEKVKDDPPNYFRGHQGTPDWGKRNHSYQVYKEDFYKFGKRLYTIGKEHNIPVTNLGKGKPYNMVSRASQEFGDTWGDIAVDAPVSVGMPSEEVSQKLKKTAFIVQARLNSERVPEKMVKKFADTNLFELVLKKLLKSKIIPNEQIFASVYPGEKELINICKKLNIKKYKRSWASANNDNNLQTIYEWHNKLESQYEYVILISGCNPLLKVETIDKFIKTFINQEEENLFAVTEKKQYYWDKKGKMITPWPKNQTIMNTKAVEPTYEAAHVLYASRLDLIKENKFMGDFEVEKGIKLFTMPELETFDIDEQWQFDLGEILYKNLR